MEGSWANFSFNTDDATLGHLVSSFHFFRPDFPVSFLEAVAFTKLDTGVVIWFFMRA